MDHPLKKKNAPVALLDSGAGGIGVLREVQKLLPAEQLLYFGDAANAPYGEKSEREILSLVRHAAAVLIPRAKALVLACNTATAVAADPLREQYADFPIIGMEPALAPAVRTVCKGASPKILVLATAATLHGQKFAALCKKHEKSATVWAVPAPDIVRLVEKGAEDSPEMDAYLHTLLSHLPTLPDAVVLGCTHFPFAGDALHRALGDIPFFDGATGTAKELYRQLAARKLLAPSNAAGGVHLYSSDPRSLPLLTRLYTSKKPL